MADIKNVTDATFENEVLGSDRPVLVDFWAAWCGPCKALVPELQKIAIKYEGALDVAKVDVDANPGLYRILNIMSLPTIALFKPGELPTFVHGFKTMDQLERMFGLEAFANQSQTA